MTGSSPAIRSGRPLGRGNAGLHPDEHHTPAFVSAVASGDSEYDACMVRYAGIGVAFCPTSDVLRFAADRVIEPRDLTQILGFVE